jgi:hypothetical protein
MFDLADKVSNEAPRVRKLVRYATFFVVFWLVLNFIFILATAGSLMIMAFLVIMFIIGILALVSLRNLNDFFKYYAMRHSFIRSVRDADPMALVPKGSTAVERLKLFLMARNPAMSQSLMAAPTPAVMKGKGGMFYQFDSYVSSRPSMGWRLFGLGYPGYQMFIKFFDKAPRPEDINAIKRAVEDVSAGTKMPASRVIMLWSRKESEDIGEESYNLLLSSTLLTRHRGQTFACALELIIENEDGTYEFIPFISEPHSFVIPRAH